MRIIHFGFALASAATAGSAANFEMDRSVIPLFTDARESVMCEFSFHLENPARLSELRLSADEGTELSAVTEVSVHALDKKGDRLLAKAEGTGGSLKPRGGAADLEPGTHRWALKVKLHPGVDLLSRIGIRVDSIHFTDGKSIAAPATAGGFVRSRLAHRIHAKGEHSCDTFRIPGLARAKDGSLIAVYDMRYDNAKDLQENIDIGMSRSTDGGRTWSQPRPIMDMGEHGGKPQAENGCSDPNILVDTVSGEIFVSALWTYGRPGTHQWKGNGSGPGFGPEETTQFMIVRSSDNGITWSQPANLTEKLKQRDWWLFAPAPGNGITLRDGTLVMPTQGRDRTGLPFSNIMSSRDRGKTWTISAPARSDTTECAVAELGDGGLLLSMRDNRNRRNPPEVNGRALAVTHDLGETWEVHPSDHKALPEPVCMASMISHRLPDGRTVLLFSNPRDMKERRNITLQASLDGGLTWPGKHRVLLDDAKGYGYSSLVMVDERTVGILFESSVADMIFMKIPLSDLIGP